MTNDPGFELVEPDDDAFAEYVARFADYNAGKSGGRAQSFSLVKREDGLIVAGGRGWVFLGALEVRGLWVDEAFRGGGLGRALLRAIEDEARRRGATRAMLYTYSWQALGFYVAEGYAEYARFAYPAGHARIDMLKEL